MNNDAYIILCMYILCFLRRCFIIFWLCQNLRLYIYIYIYIIWKEKLILFITFDCDFVLKNIEINTYTLNLLHHKTLRIKFP